MICQGGGANIFQKFCGTIGRGTENEEGKSGHS